MNEYIVTKEFLVDVEVKIEPPAPGYELVSTAAVYLGRSTDTLVVFTWRRVDSLPPLQGHPGPVGPKR